MEHEGKRLLVVDDEASIRESLVALFSDEGHRVHEAANPSEALAALRAHPVDLILLDLRLGSASGLELLPQLKAIQPEVAVVVVTALATIDTAVEAILGGADNFVTKPIDPPRLIAVVTRALEAGALRANNARLVRLAGHAGRDPEVDFGSDAMRRVQTLADAVAPHPTTVLLLGETGSGKGMLARYLHERSPRAGKPFVELNCAGLSRELTESELFGHEKGAFTGAVARKLGLLEVAHGGTLFLDEVGEMHVDVQPKLLKVIEQARFRRVGGTAEIDVDVRLVAATHRDLERDAAEGRFRADLYYRMNVFAIELPPLRARLDEVPRLARRFLAQQRRDQRLGTAAQAALEAYDWPGNVRELKNVMERAAILTPPGGEVGPEALPPLGGRAFDAATSLDHAERAAIERALATRWADPRGRSGAGRVARPPLSQDSEVRTDTAQALTVAQ